MAPLAGVMDLINHHPQAEQSMTLQSPTQEKKLIPLNCTIHTL